jgi:predicted amidohydrolase
MRSAASDDWFMKRIYCVQHDIVWENRLGNQAHVESLISQASPEAESLVILPEMFDVGFSFNLPVVAESDARETSGFLSRIASKHQIWLMGGVVRLTKSGRGLNQAVVFNPRGVEVACYTKQRPFTPGGEADFMEGGKGCVTFDWAGCLVSPFICYDLRFPEIQREAAQKRPHLITFIASWPEARIAHWALLLQARAIENQCYVAGVNRVGRDPKFGYVGRSMVISPKGEILLDAGSSEGVWNATLDSTMLAEYRSALPFLADMARSASCV